MVKLRPYQIEIKKKTAEAFKNHRRVMLQLPTGAGKTISFVDITRDIVDQGYRVWILVHRKELIDQTAAKLLKYGLDYSVIQAEYLYKHNCNVQLASVMTLVRRLDKVRDPDFIICDEAHHSTANTYRKIYENYPNTKLLGVTATPIRTDGEGFKELFDAIVCGPSVKELINQGFLVQPKVYARPLNFDLSKIKVTGGDYNEKALVEAYEQNFTYGNLVSQWEKHAKDKKTIVFAITIAHSMEIVKAYLEAGVPAEHIDGTTPKDERKAILNRFRDGRTTVISNVGIITEGFDVPDTECIQLVRPTKSLSLYLQMVGRGLRPADAKDHAIILDHSNCIYNHGWPEQDRKWTLGGVKKREGTQILVKDKLTGDLYEPNLLPDHIEEIELVEIEMDEVRIREMDKLITKANSMDFKIGFAWHKFIEKYQMPTKYEIERFQRIAGYKKGWVHYQVKEFGLL